jgi:AGZA family xanthine/uracil permease-like MFS transporter
MRDRIAAFFEFELYGATFRREFLAGITTFVTMSYIVAVNPAILKAAGIPEGASMTATIATAIFGTTLMALIANRPFAIAPYMGKNAFVAFTLVRVMGSRWQTALGAVFSRGWPSRSSRSPRCANGWSTRFRSGSATVAAGIGRFLTFIGLNESGLVTIGVPGAPVRLGNFASPAVEVAIFGFILIGALMLWRVPGAILLGILGASAAAFALGVAKAPQGWISGPPRLAPIFLALDIRGALRLDFLGVMLSIFVMALIDTMGSLVGVSARAGFLDERGNLPQIERPMIADALATTFAALAGTTTSGAFIESAAGVSAGGRTGCTAVVVAAMFAVSLFFAPIVTAIPPAAYGSALIIVGSMMMAPIAQIDFEDPTELLSAFAIIALMSFTYNIGVGITAGLVLYPFFKLIAGRRREVPPGLWALAALSLMFFIFYPYR